MMSDDRYINDTNGGITFGKDICWPGGHVDRCRSGQSPFGSFQRRWATAGMRTFKLQTNHLPLSFVFFSFEKKVHIPTRTITPNESIHEHWMSMNECIGCTGRKSQSSWGIQDAGYGRVNIRSCCPTTHSTSRLSPGRGHYWLLHSFQPYYIFLGMVPSYWAPLPEQNCSSMPGQDVNGPIVHLRSV